MPTPPPPWHLATAQIRRTRLLVGLAVLLVIAGIVTAQTLLSLVYGPERVDVVGAFVSLTGDPPVNIAVSTDNPWVITAVNRDAQPRQFSVQFNWTREDGTPLPCPGWLRMFETLTTAVIELACAIENPNTISFRTTLSPPVAPQGSHTYTLGLRAEVVDSYLVTWAAYGP